MLYLFNIFRENDVKENCAQVLEEECIKMLGTESLNDEHDCNVVSINSLNIHSTNTSRKTPIRPDWLGPFVPVLEPGLKGRY